jgi:hypothetical protein
MKMFSFKFWKWRFKRPSLTDAHGLIWASTDLFGDFNFPSCIDLILLHHVKLPWVEVQKIIFRYREHCEFWDVRLETMRHELREFADAVNYPYNTVANEFDIMKERRK